MDKLKYIKIEKADGSLSDSIPLTADAVNITMANGNSAEEEINSKINENQLNNVKNILQNQINGLASGSPLVANSINDMTDTSRIYVLTTNGHWYYYNGSNWIDGGVYQAAEDSDTVQNLIRDVYSLNSLKEIEKGNSEDWAVGMYSTNGSFNSGATYARTTDYLRVLPNRALYIYQPAKNITFRLVFFDITKKIIGSVKNYANVKVDEFINIPENAYYIRACTVTEDLPNVILKMQSFISDNKFSNISVNCLGDSLTRGFISNTDPKFMEYPMPDQLKILCGFDTVRNYGQSGTCLSNNKGYYDLPMCTRYEEMEDADVVLVMGGTNDLSTNVSLGNIDDFDSDDSAIHTFFGGLNRLAQGLITKYQTYNPVKKRHIIFVTFPQNSGVQSNKTKYQQFNQAIRDVAQRYSLPVIDLSRELGLSYLYTNNWTVGDGTHFKQETVTNIFAPYIAKKLKEIIS